MDLIETVFLLLSLVALSGVIVRFLPQLPLPLLQVGLGALAALPVTGVRLAFDPGLFLLLFVSPLLFADGWRVPKREFFQLRGPILTWGATADEASRRPPPCRTGSRRSPACLASPRRVRCSGAHGRHGRASARRGRRSGRDRCRSRPARNRVRPAFS